MVEGVTCAAVHHVLPVVALDVLVEVEILILSEVLCVRAEVVLVLQQGELILPFCVVVGVEHVEGVCDLLPAVVSVVAHVHLTALTALCRNEDNTVSTTRTVDSSRRSVLKDGDVLDVGSGDVGDGFHWESVNDVERIVALCDRTATTHTDLHLSVRRTFSSGHLHTGHLTGESF